MIICEECGEIYEAWRGQCPQYLHKHLTADQKRFISELTPDDCQYVGWIQ
jgi:predicted ATP-dependent serine protease